MPFVDCCCFQLGRAREHFPGFPSNFFDGFLSGLFTLLPPCRFLNRRQSQTLMVTDRLDLQHMSE
jgi:hypothetical protein